MRIPRTRWRLLILWKTDISMMPRSVTVNSGSFQSVGSITGHLGDTDSVMVRFGVSTVAEAMKLGELARKLQVW